MEHELYADVTHLNGFLRGELAAIRAYEECIRCVTDEAKRLQLIALKSSHAYRTSLIEQQVLRLGAQPDTKAGLWGELTHLAERGAALLGPGEAVAMLRRGEDFGSESYNRWTPELSPLSRRFIMAQVLPEQIETQRKSRGIELSFSLT